MSEFSAIGGSGNRVVVQHINVRGINKAKMVEIMDHSLQEEVNYNIVCLTETGESFERLRIGNEYQVFNSMKKEKGGGGIKVLIKRNDKVDLKEVSSKCEGILDLRGKIGYHETQILVLYMAPQRSGEGAEKNTKIEEEVIEKTKDAENRLLLVVGDCNSHINMVDPQYQRQEWRKNTKYDGCKQPHMP